MLRSQTILKALPHVLKEIELKGEGERQQGKVRDFYVQSHRRLIITTDRQSAFDVNLGFIPYKGAVLNQLAAFWFSKTQHIIPNHLIEVPHPNVSIAHNCEPIPVEMVVRGYISGVTKTSIWHSYQQGERTIYGLSFPDGLQKNQKLPHPVITPTTHGGGAGGHDERLTKAEILQRKLVTPQVYEQMEATALQLFEFGSRWCQKQGLILVDTKYEFGIFEGKLMLMDEIHTPDSSRFWVANTYLDRFKKGLEPDNYDKEFLRLWYAQKGYTGDGEPPAMIKELIVSLAQRYISVYEKITGLTFKPEPYPVAEKILQTLTGTPLSYAQSGVKYKKIDPLKKMAQQAAAKTALNLKAKGLEEVVASRGESAYVWKTGKQFRAMVVEGLGTKNLVADQMQLLTGKSYYRSIAQDTVAMIINDLVVVGATPEVINAYFAIGNSDWFSDQNRTTDLIRGWRQACQLANVTWGGGETPVLKDIIHPQTIDLSGAAVGTVPSKKHLILGDKLHAGDDIILIESSGIHANGLTLVRAIAEKLPNGLQTKLPSGKTFGESLLTPTHIYARLIQEIFAAQIFPHYLVNITGHGWRKLMRAVQPFTYHLTNIPPLPEIFTFIQQQSHSSETEMYGNFNMGAGFALFVSPKVSAKVQQIAKSQHFKSWIAGTVKVGPKQVIIDSPLLKSRIVYSEKALKLRHI